MFKSNIEKLRTHVENNEGLLLVIAAEAFFGLMDVSIKLLGTGISVLEIVWVRMVVTYAFSIAYIYYAKINDPVLGPPGVRILLTFRGLAGYIGIFGLYYSLQYLPLADAVALTFLTPLFTAIFGALLLKEKFGIKEASGASYALSSLVFASDDFVSIVISLIGAILIARPPFLFGTMGQHSEMELQGPNTMDEHEVTPHQRIVAVGVALLGAVGAAIEYTLIRIIGKRAHPLHNTTYLAMLCITATTISMAVMKTSIIVPSKWSVVGLLAFVGIFGMISQILMTMGYQREAIGRASMGVYTGMIFALILGKAVFGTVPGIISFAGTAMILGSALYTALTKGKEGEEVGEKP